MDEFIRDCLNGQLGRKHQAAAARVMRYAQAGGFVADSQRIAYAIRGLAASGRGW